MTPSRRRHSGFALALTLCLFALISCVSLIAWARLHEQRIARPLSEHRTQALWLARSAAAAGRPLQREVRVGGETATVAVRIANGRIIANAQLARGGIAEVTVTPGQPWQERWDGGR